MDPALSATLKLNIFIRPIIFLIFQISSLYQPVAAHVATGYVDTQVLGEHEPGRLEFRVDTTDDMLVRVVRSMRGVIYLPELGVRIDPGPACEGFVTNIEGVLERIANVVRGVLSCGEAGEKEKASVLLDKIELIRDGRLPATLIIDDPSGNSAIVSEKTKKSPIPEDDCNNNEESPGPDE